MSASPFQAMFKLPTAVAFKGSGLIRRTVAAASLAVGGAALSVLLSPMPSLAASIYHWNVEGDFGNNDGPAKFGRFTGFFNWDTTGGGTLLPSYGSVPLTTYLDASLLPGGYTAGNGTGGFTFWDFKFYNQAGQFIQRLHSHNLTGGNATPTPNEETAVMTNVINPDSGCFGSPLEKGNGASGTYFESNVGGQVCTGYTNFISPLTNSPAPTATTRPVYFSVVQDEPFFYAPAGAGLTFTHSYFRIPLLASTTSLNGPATGENFSILPYNPNSDEWFGWSLYTFGLIEPPDLTSVVPPPGTAVSTACNGDNGAVPPSPACPYSGNNQPRQGLAGATDIVITQNEIPAPLPLAGAAPLSFALTKLARRRKQLLEKA